MKKIAEAKVVETKEIVIKPPLEIISEALQKGQSLEALEKLLSLQERFEANQARKAYYKAMSDFKTENIKILKDFKVDYDTKTGGKVKYKYATLFNITETITPLLSKHGLSVSWRRIAQDMKEKNLTIACIVTHTLGHSEEFSLTGPFDDSGGKNAIQGIGSASAYLERYTVLMAFGLATKDQDNDGKIIGKPEVSRPGALSEKPAITGLSDKTKKDFERAQKILGDEVFFKILGGEGYEKVEQISNEGVAIQILRDMKTYHEQHKA